jgi:hypothetical protein
MDETFAFDLADQAEAPTWDVLAPGVTIGIRRAAARHGALHRRDQSQPPAAAS